MNSTSMMADRSQRILVVDDHRDGADALGWLIEELGNDVEVTYSATRALEIAPTFRPDLIITDLVMPGMDGYGFVRQVRQIPDFARVKIVAVTGKHGDDFQPLAMSAGFDTVLRKPVSLTELKATLSAMMARDSSNAVNSPPACHRLRGQCRSDFGSAPSRSIRSPMARSNSATR
jgi:CheY-like chemotaxis protein